VPGERRIEMFLAISKLGWAGIIIVVIIIALIILKPSDDDDSHDGADEDIDGPDHWEEWN